MEVVRVRKRFQITLPTAIREAASVCEGDFLTAEVREDGTIVMRLGRLVDADEAFLYTPEWQAAEREADEDIRLGRVQPFDSVEEAIGFLQNHDEANIERSDAD